jgi:hypothetical protein
LKTGSSTSRRLLPYSRIRAFDGGLRGSRGVSKVSKMRSANVSLSDAFQELFGIDLDITSKLRDVAMV